MNLRELLDQERLLVGDGAMGTQLIARGLPAGVPGELWNVDMPHVVEAVQRDYVAAGARYLLTNTFGANVVALSRHGLGARVEAINTAAVHIARRAAGGKAIVFGDLGPTGTLLAPVGDLRPDEALQGYAAQVRALASAGAGAIVAETFDSSEELHIALTAAREECDLPLVASMRFGKEASGRYRTIMGEGPQALVDVARDVGCVAAGTNCGQSIASMAGLVAQIAELTDVPVIAQPNAGKPRLAHGATVYDETVATFAEHLPALYRAGARVIGGCCGTTPEHIRAIRSFADAL